MPYFNPRKSHYAFSIDAGTSNNHLGLWKFGDPSFIYDEVVL
jgi:hypothetical protein